jgi:hypothetical protein
MVQRTSEVGNPSGSYYEKKVQNGQDTPKHLRDRGIYTVNPYTMDSVALRRNDCLLVDQHGNPLNGTRYFTNSFISESVGPERWPMEADVLNKLGEKWRGTDLNLGMYMSPEGRESVQMMITSLQKISNSARSLKRGDFGGFLRNMNELPAHARKRSARKFNQGDLSGAFLSAHLGWEPLIKDAYEASGLVQLEDKPHRITARKLGGRDVDAYNIGNYPGSTFTVDKKVQVRLTLDMERTPTFAERFGLENPFLIAWELVPLSFVADYFLPIGSVIQAMGNVSMMYGSRGWRKAWSHYDYKVRMPKGVKALTAWWVDYYLSVDIETNVRSKKFNRSVYTPSFIDPLTSLRVTLPESVMKLATLGSLTHQRILSLKRH